MTKFLSLLGVVVVVLLASPAFAQDAWRKGADSTDDTCDHGVTPGGACFFQYTNSTTDSNVLKLYAASHDVCFDPNVASAVNTGASVGVMFVTGDDCTDATASANTATKINNLTLTGAPGSADCISDVPAGCIWIDVISTTAAQTSLVSVRGRPDDDSR